MRDNKLDEEGQAIPTQYLTDLLNKKNAVNYNIILDNEIVGGLILNINKEKNQGELDLLFVNKNMHSKGIGTSTWKTVEKIYPEIELWITYTPYYDKRNIHFYMNVLGFHAVEFTNNYIQEKNNKGNNNNEGDDFFKFEKRIKKLINLIIN